MIERFLQQSADSRASDIFLDSNDFPWVRRGGKLLPVEEFGCFSAEMIEEFRRKILSEEQEENYKLTGSADAVSVYDTGHRFRLNFYASKNGHSVACRPILDGGSIYLHELGLPEQLVTMAESPRGLILICGSTGSGKSTTLAGMINHINRNFSRHILTIEDPIEFTHDNIRSLVSQREIGRHTTNFSAAIRDALRENPDVIIIGEMRDKDTIAAAVEAALTGHLVISTLHTADTMQAVERLINIFPEEYRRQLSIDLSSALIGLSAQRLIPRKDQPDQMVAATEIMMGTPTVCKLISEQKFSDLDSVLHEGGNSGMESFTRAVFQLLSQGLISQEDAMKSVDSEEELNMLLTGMERGVDAFRTYVAARKDNEDGVDMPSLLYSAMKLGSSDLMLTVDAPPSIRLDGTVRAMDLPAMRSFDIQKLLYGLLTPHQRIEFEEKRELDFALAVSMKNPVSGTPGQCRFRVNAFHQRGNIGVVARVINMNIPSPQELLLPDVMLELIRKQQGLILVTGPTGSGKSTTLASLIDQINTNTSSHIITIEDPIEYVHKNKKSIIEQRELYSDTHSFSTALKYALREDPDVIMVGEMRDVETMQAALTAAETGHLVLSTIHTNNAPQTIDRIVDSFPSFQQNQIRQQLAGVLLGVFSQRLLPRAGIPGRIAAFEVMVGTPAVRALIRENKTHMLQSAIETAGKDGMITMEKYLERLCAGNLVDRRTAANYFLSVHNTAAF